MGNNRYILQWEDYMKKAKESLENNNFDEYKDFMDKANETADLLKHDNELTYECVNFGMANYIFENALPTIFKNNKAAVKEFTNTIKEDKNLRKQFQFYKALETYTTSLNSRDYLNESLNLVKETIDKKTLEKSNKKLGEIINKYSIKPSEMISEDKLKFFADCDYLLKNDKKLNNLVTVTECVNRVSDYIEKNYNTINESKTNTFALIEDFDKKYNNLLNEEEKSFVKEIIDCKSSSNRAKKETLFNKFKNECLELINKLMAESNGDDVNDLNAIKEQIDAKVFCEETLVKDVANLLEIRDILKS